VLREELQASRAECTDLAHRLDLEKANHARLIAAVRCVQQTKPSATIGSVVSAGPWLPGRGETPEAAESSLPATGDDDSSAIASDSGCSDRPVTASALMEKAPHPEQDDGALDFNPSEYVRELLNEIEAVYDADQASGMPFNELVDRLIGNLRYGAAVFARRIGFASSRDRNIFHQQLTAILDAKGGTVFGRHLAIAAYDYEQQNENTHAQVA
jgi:hypothetical protein